MATETEVSSCCSPAPLNLPPARPAVAMTGAAGADHRRRLYDAAVEIPGGQAEIGTDRPYLPLDGEGPRRFVKVKSYRLGATAVTNAEFAAFVAATRFVTEAERFGWSFVFHHYVEGVPETAAAMGIEWWRRVDGALWNRPNGPTSSLVGRDGHPVVHVSWNDAAAYAKWAGARLPTEAEWEHAARGGLSGALYPWGDQHPDDTENFPCNIWQGRFPDLDSGGDGYRGLAPAQSFSPNGYGLYNMSGNCWEWTADAFRVRSLRREAKLRDEQARRDGQKLLKGGSHLCHASYCHRYRIAARMGNTPDSTTGHTGFRVAFDIAD
ncbi:MAG TPA: formylglycine-generating enzyme family protein [Devosiaceae bacterium]|jgi:formylglycine-generating enzyme required for sulfatase activity